MQTVSMQGCHISQLTEENEKLKRANYQLTEAVHELLKKINTASIARRGVSFATTTISN